MWDEDRPGVQSNPCGKLDLPVGHYLNKACTRFCMTRRPITMARPTASAAAPTGQCPPVSTHRSVPTWARRAKVGRVVLGLSI